MVDDLDPLEHHLLEGLRSLASSVSPVDVSPIAEAAWCAERDSRLIDHAARWLQAQRLGFYTIGSAGHECNAARRAGAATDRPGPPALPLRRLLPRARRPGRSRRRPRRPARDGGCDGGADRRRPAQGVRPPRAGRDPADLDHRLAPAARGRHRRRRSSGAQAPGARRRPGPGDAVVVCSFGDASLNHATAQSALQRGGARRLPWRAPADPLRVRGQRHRHQRPPPRSPGSSSRSTADRSSRYERGRRARTPLPRPRTATELAGWVREHRRPAVLHLRTVRYLGHAGADVETAYRTAARDPRRLRPRPAARDRALARRGQALARGAELADEYLAERERDPRPGARGDAPCRSSRAADATSSRPLAPRTPDGGAPRSRAVPRTAAPATEPLTLAQAINARPRRRARALPRRARLRRGRRPQGRRLRRHAWPAGALRRGARVRHPPRRDVDPRARARRRR